MNFFSLILGVGASLGLVRVLQASPAAERFRWLSAGLITLIGSLIGARLGFIIAYAGYFKINVYETLMFWQGGLSWPGAVVGAYLFARFAVVLIRKPYTLVLDKLSVLLLPIATAVWLGCWKAGIAYGQVLETGTWWGILTKDESGLEAIRVPVQPAAALSLLLILGITEWIIVRSQPLGVKNSIIGLVFSLHALLFSFMRVDPVQRFLSLRLDSWAAILILLGSSFLLLIRIRKKQKRLSINTKTTS